MSRHRPVGDGQTVDQLDPHRERDLLAREPVDQRLKHVGDARRLESAELSCEDRHFRIAFGEPIKARRTSSVHEQALQSIRHTRFGCRCRPRAGCGELKAWRIRRPCWLDCDG